MTPAEINQAIARGMGRTVGSVKDIYGQAVAVLIDTTFPSGHRHLPNYYDSVDASLTGPMEWLRERGWCWAEIRQWPCDQGLEWTATVMHFAVGNSHTGSATTVSAALALAILAAMKATNE